MATWTEFRRAAPDIEAAGRALLYQHGVGLGYLATVGLDGSPRVHPVCPLLDGTGIFVFVIPSPKQRDLLRDGHYALHSYPRGDDEDAFYLTGRARHMSDQQLRQALSDQFVAERTRFAVPPPAADQALFELDVDRCLLTITTGHGDPAPQKVVWRAEGPRTSAQALAPA